MLREELLKIPDAYPLPQKRTFLLTLEKPSSLSLLLFTSEGEKWFSTTATQLFVSQMERLTIAVSIIKV